MTGYKWVCYPRKIWNVIQQRWGGVFITGSTQWLCHEKGGPKAALSQSNSQSGNALTNAFSLRIPVTIVEIGTLPRFEAKAKRWIRYDRMTE